MDFLFQYLQQGFVSIFAIVVMLGALVFFHELGHFLMAKLCGVSVETFSLGFGPRVVSFEHKGTVYCISLLPFGGFVKMKGDDPTGDYRDPEGYLGQPPSKRIAILLAGPLMNLALAFALYLGISLSGEKAIGPVVGDLESQSLAYRYGFRSGDKILKINGQSVSYWEDVEAKIRSVGDQALNFEIARPTESELVLLSAKADATESGHARIEGLSPLQQAPIFGYMGERETEVVGAGRLIRVLSINSSPVSHLMEAKERIQSAVDPSQVQIEYTLNLDSGINPKAKGSRSATVNSSDLMSSESFVLSVEDQSPAESAGIMKGDLVVAVNSRPIARWADLLEAVQGHNSEEPMQVKILRGGESLVKEVKPQVVQTMGPDGNEVKRQMIGIRSAQVVLPKEFVLRSYPTVWGHFQRATEQTTKFTSLVAGGIYKFVSGQISSKNLGGPVLIGQTAVVSLQVGIHEFLAMMALISINLFVFNLLPVPLLDGGNLLFCLVELIKGAPVSLNKLMVANQIGFALLITLMVYALFNDVSRLFTSPF